MHACTGNHSFSVTLKTSILLSKLPLQQVNSPRKPCPTQMGCSGISLVGCTKMLPVSQYNVGCAVVQSGNTGWSSLKCSLPSKNNSQPTVRCISYHFPVCLVRFQANFGFLLSHTGKYHCSPLGPAFCSLGKGTRPLTTGADFENASLWFVCSHVIFKSGLAVQMTYGTGSGQCVKAEVSKAVLCGSAV